MKTVGELRAALEGYDDEDEFHLHVDLWASQGISMTLDPGLVSSVRTEPAANGSPRGACLMVGEWK